MDVSTIAHEEWTVKEEATGPAEAAPQMVTIIEVPAFEEVLITIDQEMPADAAVEMKASEGAHGNASSGPMTPAAAGQLASGVQVSPAGGCQQ
jgi:hypothetical protein